MPPRKRKINAASESPKGQDGIKRVSDSMMSTFDIFSDNVYAPIEGDGKAEELCIRSKVCVLLFVCVFLLAFAYNDVHVHSHL
jgi:hypothetical protein